MPSLPQNDPSRTRGEELATRRGYYDWDDEYFAPFPFLHIPDIARTGVLNIAEILIGSFLALPPPERPPSSWLIGKTAAAMNPTLALASKVNPVKWVELVRSVRRVMLRHLTFGLDKKIATLVETSESQTGGNVAGRLATNIATALAEEITQDMRNPGFVARIVSFLAGARANDLIPVEAGISEACERAREAGLDEQLVRTLLPLQGFLRLLAEAGRLEQREEASVEAYGELISTIEPPEGGDPTQDDFLFGRRHVAGCNPVTIHRVRDAAALPEGFQVSDDTLRQALAAYGAPEAGEATLAGAAAAGRLYLTDYAALDGLKCQSGPVMDFFGLPVPGTERQRYVTAPYGLFYVRRDGGRPGLYPVAIQLGRDASIYETFTPAVDATLWRKAKALYLCGDFNHHELCTHLAGVHFTLEAFVVATRRQLHPDHPVAVLLFKHTNILLWNNFLGRQVLANPEGFLTQLLPGEYAAGSMALMASNYETFHFSQWDFPAEIASRGADDAEALPVYPYRDDGLLLWGAILEFVTEYLGLYYADAESFEGDHELRAWAAEMAAQDGARVPGFPERFDSVEGLAHALTSIIFHTSAHHSAINYTQYDLQGWVPWVPSTLVSPPHEVREHDLLAFLPAGELAFTQQGVMHVLAGFKGEVLMEYSPEWFEDVDVWPLVGRLRHRLQAIEAEIDARNAGPRADAPYPYMKPSRVTCCSNV